VGADADLSHVPTGDSAMATELRAVSGLDFRAFQLAHRKPGAWLKPASAPTSQRDLAAKPGGAGRFQPLPLGMFLVNLPHALNNITVR